ncbi:DMT family transporter [Brevibacillus choshinensis]|uniref:DMT family transporter n=1 Tax=Brevibacillus choshinensis TaxID=54911 RepID=A0ABX7FK67_BRECH|nr:DMT family transporter [Brevibacillus choshinensis]QRG66173.1 DMT family transporter [Brevibacillus choshinensis]
MSRSLFLVLTLLSLIWGGSFFFLKILLHDFGPWTIAFMRSALGLITITLVMLSLKKPIGFRHISWVPMIIMALINTAIPWSLIAFSETRLTSTMASVLNATTPLWTLAIGMLFFKAVSGRMQWLGMLIAFCGIIVLLDVNPVSLVSVDLLGFVCMMGATCAYAIGGQLSKRLPGNLSMYQITFGTLLSSMIGSGGLALMTESFSFSGFASASTVASLIGLGVFGSGVAYILYYYLVQKGGPEIASLVTYLIPITAFVWGYTLLNEEITWNLLVGMVFIVGGVFLTGRKEKPKAKVTVGA